MCVCVSRDSFGEISPEQWYVLTMPERAVNLAIRGHQSENLERRRQRAPVILSMPCPLYRGGSRLCVSHLNPHTPRTLAPLLRRPVSSSSATVCLARSHLKRPAISPEEEFLGRGRCASAVINLFLLFYRSFIPADKWEKQQSGANVDVRSWFD